MLKGIQIFDDGKSMDIRSAIKSLMRVCESRHSSNDVYHMGVMFFLSLLITGCFSERTLKSTAITYAPRDPNIYAHMYEEYGLVSEKLNAEIKNLTVTIDRNSGELKIRFDYPSGLWVKKVDFPISLLIRIFDKNGSYITRFTTKEEFLPEKRIAGIKKWKEGRDPATLPALVLGDGAVPLKPKDNLFIYKINMKDAEFANIVEVGFSNTEFAVVPFE
jgi:hypothetical protein